MTDLLSDLTAAQRAAVTHVDGPLLVLAGAGSGKTRVITRRVAHLLSLGVASEQILALTFTNKAANEMRERIEAQVPQSRVWVGTFHGFCARLLRKYAKLVGIDPRFSIYDQSDRLRAIRDMIEQFDWNEPGWTAERIEAVISRAKNDLIGPRQSKQRAVDRKAEMIAQVYELYEERLKAASAVDFDDLLVHAVAILKEHKDVRADLDRHFRYVLVDEYQDTNLAQYAIVRALSVDHPNLCVTGDPDQSIYSWRGANLANILEFERDFPGCRVVKLERNYRSTKNILSVADHLIRFNRNRKPKSLLTENPQGEPVELTLYPHETDEAESHRRQDRQPGARGHLPLLRHRRLLPGDRPDAAFRASPPRSSDPLPDRRRLRILRATRNQGRTLILESDRQSQGRPGVRAGGQRSAPRLGENLDRTSGRRGAERGIPLLAMARDASVDPRAQRQGHPRPARLRRIDRGACGRSHRDV